jgi:protein-disulfide reductase (glutathione)
MEPASRLASSPLISQSRSVYSIVPLGHIPETAPHDAPSARRRLAIMLITTSRIRRAAGTALAALALLTLAGTADAGGDWNDGGIGWKPYEQGLAEAKSSGKPVLLVFYTEWCPHCTNYSKVFHNPELVELSKKFVMIRVDKDQDPAASAKYTPDGEYIPRTYFLKSDGTLMPEITEQRPQYKYFYDESSPAGVTRSMKTVLARK